MPRTIINLDPDDKAWLDREAKARQVPMTEVVRQAIRRSRLAQERRRPPHLHDALRRTAGLWRQGDGLAWQERLRAEWER
jgi:hypothetical protein